MNWQSKHHGEHVLFHVKNNCHITSTMETMFHFTFLAYTIHTFLDLVNVECNILPVVICISSMDMGKTMENTSCFKVEFHMHHTLFFMLSVFSINRVAYLPYPVILAWRQFINFLNINFRMCVLSILLGWTKFFIKMWILIHKSMALYKGKDGIIQSMWELSNICRLIGLHRLLSRFLTL